MTNTVPRPHDGSHPFAERPGTRLLSGAVRAADGLRALLPRQPLNSRHCHPVSRGKLKILHPWPRFSPGARERLGGGAPNGVGGDLRGPRRQRGMSLPKRIGPSTARRSRREGCQQRALPGADAIAGGVLAEGRRVSSVAGCENAQPVHSGAQALKARTLRAPSWYWSGSCHRRSAARCSG